MLDAIVTGASGFIGKAVCDRLDRDGLEVLRLQHTDGCVTDEVLWKNLPKSKALIHLAGRSYVPDSWQYPADFMQANVVGTQRALSWCKAAGARMVFSSAYVYGTPQRLPIHESDMVRPNNPYAISKYLAEQLCEFAARVEKVDVTALRIFNVFGPGQRAEFLIPSLIGQLQGREIRVMDMAPRRDYVYLADVVEAFSKAYGAPQGYHCLNIGSGQSYSVAELVAEIQTAAGTVLPVASAGVVRPQEISDVRADTTQARKVLDWSPTWTLSAGLREILEGVNRE